MSKINNKNSTIKRVLLQIRPYLPTIILLLALCRSQRAVLAVHPGARRRRHRCHHRQGTGQLCRYPAEALHLRGAHRLRLALAQWLMNFCGNKVTYNIIRDMREAAFKKIHRLPFSYLDAHETGDIVSRIIADVDQFADGLLMGFSQLFTGVVTDHRHHRLHAFRQRLDNACRGACHAAFHFGGALHRKENVRHVPLTVRNTRPPDGIHQ